MTHARALALAVTLLSACTREEATIVVPANEDVRPSEIAPVAPGEVCGAVRTAFTKHIASVDTSCTSDADCALYDVQLDPCDLPLAFATRAADVADALRTLRTDTHKLCGAVARPCPAPIAHVVCEKARCVAREGHAAPIVPTWRAVLSTSDGPLASTPVHVALSRQVQCVTAPCPPQNAGALDLTTDANGVVRIGLDTDLTRANTAELTVAGYAPVTVNLGPMAPTQAPAAVMLRQAP